MIGILTSGFAQAAPRFVDVEIGWTYETFPLRIEIYEVKSDRSPYVSETGIADKLKDMPIATKIAGQKIKAGVGRSVAFVLLTENTTKEDVYFFAVPHELNPHHASAGHYFECLCIGRLFKVPPGKFWYRIVRLSLNNTFKTLSGFKISHQIIGVSRAEALGKYKDQLYER